MDQEERGRAGRDPDVGREDLRVLHHQVAGIGQDREVRPAACLIDGVERRVGALFEVGGGRPAQMGARREADHADPLRIDAPLCRLAAHQADCPLGVLERARRRQRHDLPRTAGDAVLEQDTGHAE